ncbi:terminase small subunit [Bordetella avium]|nr:terminase small subunit [Bordetella avium]RIQ11466.1 terminase small subunit [Bordetella avium]RIQ17465.1 terminase small subunit [Bordetella avium]RIQ49288.1 terminase small subunit [Bordetella avium]RIQ58118.1 terminase small subunit [Bordetella avium]RIQ59148.1 terminase small subunit [Bordetella avium]
MALTAKQRRFVDEYLVDLNATQAAIRAGYSKKTARQIGEENLSKPDIAKAVQEAQAARSKRTEITQDMVLRELAKIGFADIRKVVNWGSTTLQAGVDDDGNPTTEVHHGLVLVASNEIDDATAAAISEVSEGREGLKVKFHDKKGALVDIGRHLGMFKDRVEHSGPGGGPIKSISAVAATPEEAAKIYQQMMSA